MTEALVERKCNCALPEDPLFRRPFQGFCVSEWVTRSSAGAALRALLRSTFGASISCVGQAHRPPAIRVLDHADKKPPRVTGGPQIFSEATTSLENSDFVNFNQCDPGCSIRARYNCGISPRF